MEFPTKIDWWLAAILVVVPIALAGQAWMYRSVATAIPLVVIVVMYGILLIPISYTLGADSLEIRNGMIRSRIPYASIVSVQPTHNPLSAPAMSLDRLALKLGNGQTQLISPKDQTGFIQELSQRVPGLKVLPR